MSWPPSRRWIAAALALVVLLGVGAVTLFEIRSKAVESRFTGEAARNPLLAARRTLRRLGVDAQTLWTLGPEGLKEIAGGTVLIANVPREDLTRIALQFGPWVASGGQLVVALAGQRSVDGSGEASGEEPERDEGLWSEGRRDVEIRGDGPGPGPWEAVAQGLRIVTGDLPVLRQQTIPLMSGGLGGVVDFEVLSRFFLSGDGHWSAAGDCLASRAYGAGRLSVLCDVRPLTNPHLGERDHARLLWLLTVGEEPAPVWLVLGVEYPGFVSWLWLHARAALLGVFGFLGLWLLSRAARFGPMLTPPRAQRRSVLEHAGASARFEWRMGAVDALLAPLGESVIRAASRHHPGIRNLEPGQIESELQRLAGPDGARAGRILSEGLRPIGRRRSITDGQLLDAVQVLERTRRRL